MALPSIMIRKFDLSPRDLVVSNISYGHLILLIKQGIGSNGGRAKNTASMGSYYQPETQLHPYFPQHLGNVQRHTRLIIDRLEAFYDVPLNAVPPLQPFHYFPPDPQPIPQPLLPSVHEADAAFSIPAFCVPPALQGTEPDNLDFHPGPQQQPLSFEGHYLTPEDFLAAPTTQAQPFDFNFSQAPSPLSGFEFDPPPPSPISFAPSGIDSHDPLSGFQPYKPTIATPIVPSQREEPLPTLPVTPRLVPQERPNRGSRPVTASGTDTPCPLRATKAGVQKQAIDTAAATEIVAPAPTSLKDERDEASSTVSKLETVASGRVRKANRTTSKAKGMTSKAKKATSKRAAAGKRSSKKKGVSEGGLTAKEMKFIKDGMK
ncbi:MAG: hypothetical protein Q9220_003578 [cf. Caloplaca sp. 1 TL-2023]